MRKFLVLATAAIILSVAAVAGRVGVAQATATCSLSQDPAVVVGTFNGFSLPVNADFLDGNEQIGGCSGVGGQWQVQIYLQYKDTNIGTTWINGSCVPATQWPGGLCKIGSGLINDNVTNQTFDMNYADGDKSSECPPPGFPTTWSWRLFYKFQDSSGNTIDTEHNDVLSCSN